jgi:two-component system NarL family sensor kinase
MSRQLTLPHNKTLAKLDYRHQPILDRNAAVSGDVPRPDESFSLDGTEEKLEELLRIHEYERRRLGQELHDSTGQLVVSLLLSLSRLRRIEEGYGHAVLIDEIQEIVGLIDKEVRSLAFLHCPAELADRSLSASVESLAIGFGRRTGMHIGFKCVGEATQTNEAVSIALLRVTQEALVNVHRHSHATSAKVELRYRPGRLGLRISDDGIGMPETGEAAKSDGIGVQGMRHRIEAQGGSFEIRGLHPGTMICAAVPIPLEA